MAFRSKQRRIEATLGVVREFGIDQLSFDPEWANSATRAVRSGSRSERSRRGPERAILGQSGCGDGETPLRVPGEVPCAKRGAFGAAER